jgi:hypothetical protein
MTKTVSQRIETTQRIIPQHSFRRQKDGGQKNVFRLLYAVIVNFLGMIANSIFLS